MSVKRTVVQAFPIPELPGYESRMVVIEYPPRAAAPLHNHPVKGSGFVLSGSVISQFEGGKVEEIKAGEGFVDLGDTPHIQARNGSETEWLRFLVVYVIRIGEANVKVLEAA